MLYVKPTALFCNNEDTWVCVCMCAWVCVFFAIRCVIKCVWSRFRIFAIYFYFTFAVSTIFIVYISFHASFAIYALIKSAVFCSAGQRYSCHYQALVVGRYEGVLYRFPRLTPSWSILIYELLYRNISRTPHMAVKICFSSIKTNVFHPVAASMQTPF